MVNDDPPDYPSNLSIFSPPPPSSLKFENFQDGIQIPNVSRTYLYGLGPVVGQNKWRLIQTFQAGWKS